MPGDNQTVHKEERKVVTEQGGNEESKPTTSLKKTSGHRRGRGKKQLLKEPAKKKVAGKVFNIRCISSPPPQVRKNIGHSFGYTLITRSFFCLFQDKVVSCSPVRPTVVSCDSSSNDSSLSESLSSDIVTMHLHSEEESISQALWLHFWQSKPHTIIKDKS